MCKSCKGSGTKDGKWCVACVGSGRCPLCGGHLVRSSEKYQVCGKGHGKLFGVKGHDKKKADKEERDLLRKADEAIKEDRA